MKISLKERNKIFLKLSSAVDTRLIGKFLGDTFEIQQGEKAFKAERFELIIVDLNNLEKLEPYIRDLKGKIGDVLLPLMVLIEREEQRRSPIIWELADEIIEIPVPKEIFHLRVKNLLKSRQYSKRIEKKQNKLKQKNKQLKLYFNAINASISGMTITDCTREDNPIIFCNKAFTELTGYSRKEVLGRNCRFLQGDDRDQESRSVIREAVENGKPCDVLIRNYRKDGTLFWNELKISPIRNHYGKIEYMVGIQNNVTELLEIQQHLRQAKNQWESILKQSPNMIQISVNGVIEFINQAGVKMYGAKNAEEIIGSTIFELHNIETRKEINNRFERLQQGEILEPKIYNFESIEGKLKHIKVQSALVEYEGKKALQTVGQDVTEILKSQQNLKDTLHQKEVLLQEVHHRVKNNLAVINALIELQKEEIKSEEALTYLDDTQMRIVSIAKVHETLYQQEDMNENDFGVYIRSLTSQINKPLTGTEAEIDFEIEGSDIRLSLDQAIPCSLLMNELISNSQKHGFRKGKTRKIIIKITLENGWVKIHYRDNGKGFDEDFNFESDGNFGATVIQMMLQQLKAQWTYGTNDGVYFDIEFKKENYTGPSGKLS